MVMPEEIRTMDGPALTRLAVTLGLAPEGSSLYDQRGAVVIREAGGNHYSWIPHADLAQADAVFRQLRARGWRIDASSTQDSGGCSVLLKQQHAIVVWWGENYADTEPLALLRCACLAAASAEEDTHA